MNKVDLDDLKAVKRLDSSDMLSAIDRFPDSLADPDGTIVDWKEAKLNVSNLVLMGMGGSAGVGDVVLGWLRSKLKIPALVQRRPDLPRFVGPNTLFVTVSYSGETDETLNALRVAKKRGAFLVGIGTGGRLERLCSEFQVPFVATKPSVAPRAALSQMLVAVTTVLESAGLVRSTSSEMRKSGRELLSLRERVRVQTPFERNRAKRLALQLFNRFLVLYSMDGMRSVARRFNNQLAENAKTASKYAILPEACHNEIESWRGRPDLAPIFIRGNESVVERSIIESFRSTVRPYSRVAPIDVRILGGNRLSSLMAPIFFLDYVSVYLALLKKIDPTPTDLIAKYKRLVKSG